MRQRSIGKVTPIEKIWLSKKELAAYLGVSERFLETTINANPKVEKYQLSDRKILYSKASIDKMILKSKI